MISEENKTIEEMNIPDAEPAEPAVQPEETEVEMEAKTETKAMTGEMDQEDLIAQRDEYGANDIKPGLTGWAQINGRDELEISVKAKLDGEYVARESFLFDCKCFFKTIGKVLKSDGVVEGGTGEIHKMKEKDKGK